MDTYQLEHNICVDNGGLDQTTHIRKLDLRDPYLRKGPFFPFHYQGVYGSIIKRTDGVSLISFQYEWKSNWTSIYSSFRLYTDYQQKCWTENTHSLNT